MKKYYRKISGMIKPFLLVFILLVAMIPEPASAASVSVSVKGGTIEKGETITVTVSLSSSASIGAYKLYLTYDSSVIEYVPSAGDDSFCNGGGGTLIFVGDPYATSDSCSVTFKGINAGTSKLTISYDAGDILDTEYNDMTATLSSGSVTVNPPRQASSDATLSGLTIGDGVFSPSFSPDVTEYNISVNSYTEALTINATPNSSYAKVSISGNELYEGENTVKITVTAENGNQKIYYIYVTKAAATPTPTPGPTPTPTPTPVPTIGAQATIKELVKDEQGNAVIKDITLTVMDTITVNIPAGFDKTSATVQGFSVEALKLNDGNTTLVQLSDNRLYIYDAGEGSFVLYQTISTLPRYYQICMAEDSMIPAGYILIALEIDGEVYPAYSSGNASDFVLLYSGDGQWYKYDMVEFTMQRYDDSDITVNLITQAPVKENTPVPGITVAADETITVATDETATPASVSGETGTYDTAEIIRLVIILLVFILAILFMILYVRERNRNLKFIAEEQEEIREQSAFEAVETEAVETEAVKTDAEINEIETDDAFREAALMEGMSPNEELPPEKVDDELPEENSDEDN
ncbi:MAG: cadherin-like beta sandwich domain-containing protein [Lachnospiraceae bacterium]